MQNQNGTVLMEQVADANVLAKARKQRERFNRNALWLQAHVPIIYSQHRGKCICVAGEELFVADSAKAKPYPYLFRARAAVTGFGE